MFCLLGIYKCFCDFLLLSFIKFFKNEEIIIRNSVILLEVSNYNEMKGYYFCVKRKIVRLYFLIYCVEI